MTRAEQLTARRTLLKQIAAAAAIAGATSVPALAQQKTEQPPSTPQSGQVPVAEALARYAINLKYEDLPPEVVRTATRTILDTVGCAIGGYKAGPSQIAVKLASDVTARQGATVLCSGIKTSPDLAVFANGVMMRYLDFNDGYVSYTHSPGHPSDTLAALLTAAELSGCSGRDLIIATVLSFEVFCKVLDVMDTQALGVDHSTITGLAAVVRTGLGAKVSCVSAGPSWFLRQGHAPDSRRAHSECWRAPRGENVIEQRETEPCV